MGTSEKLFLNNIKQYVLLLLVILGASTMISGNACSAVLVSSESEQKGTAISELNPGTEDILDTAHFSEETRRTHQLLNPPKNLHPWLKWLLYSSRLDKKMVLNYYATLKKRDQIYQRAVKSSGQLGIVYQGKVFRDIPPFVTPDWADGDYSLVKFRQKISEGPAYPEKNTAVSPLREEKKYVL
jgi:hypothetical protein